METNLNVWKNGKSQQRNGNYAKISQILKSSRNYKENINNIDLISDLS